MADDELVARYLSGNDAGNRCYKRAVLTRKKYSLGLSWVEKEAGIGGGLSTKCARIGYVANGICDGMSDTEVALGGRGGAVCSKVPMKKLLDYTCNCECKHDRCS
jgi:hypothetical protein